MQFSTDQVEAVVHEVLRRLAATTNGEKFVRVNGHTQRDELVLTTPLVTLSDLEGRLQGVYRVTVSRGTVITPAAKDLLTKHGVVLRFVSGDAPPGVLETVSLAPIPYLAPAPAQTPAARRRLKLAVGTCFHEPLVYQAFRALTEEGHTLEYLPSTDLVHTVDQLAARVAATESLGLLTTSETTAALCLANRYRRVRAAVAATPSQVEEALEAVGANLLILSPQGKGLAQLVEIVATFCRPACRPCPSRFSGRLD